MGQFDRPQGIPPGMINQGGPSAVEDSAPYQDRTTGEDIRNDWEFTVLVAVVLDPKPPAAAAPTAAAQ
jgi:hypothetical protein